MSRVLVTGGAGYVGSILCEHLLAADYQVTVAQTIQHGEQSLFHLCSNPGFEFVRGDVRDKETVASCLRGADVIMPLAAIVGAPSCDRQQSDAVTVNLEAIRLLGRLRSARQLVVFPTTNSGYGTQSAEPCCNEETPLAPISLYGRTKVEAEAEVLGWPGSISLRLATVFGMSPRMRTDLLVNHFVWAAATEGYLVIFEKDFRRNFVHVRDVAECFIHCVERQESMAGRAFNVGLDDCNLSKENLARRIKRLIPELFLHFAATGSDPDRRDYLVSNQRLREAGFVAGRSLEEGIQELVKGYRMIGPSRYCNA
jgi:nucleoside-diphosphate-sugar epimerase